MSARTILIVDDDDANRLTLAALLEDEGLPVVEAASLDEARAALGEHRIALVLADYHLEDGLGTELVADVRAHDPGARLVLISGDEVASLPGIDGALRKGDDPKAALQRIKAWLSPRPAEGPAEAPREGGG